MSLEPLPGFKSLSTHHCVTGSMKHIYHFHSHPISEEMLLGLGAGLGFVYWHMKGAPPIIGGRGNVGRPGEEGLEKTAGRRTGVAVETYRTGSGRKAEKRLLEMFSGGEPVMIMVDMGFLPYFEFPEEYHFGGHVVVVAGYDPESKQVLVADRDAELYPVSLENLAKARGSKFQPFPPGNAWYEFDFSGKRGPEPEEVSEAIREVTTRMLQPPIKNLGVAGIRTAAGRILDWPKVLGEEDARFACFNAFIFIDATGGTGGGIFRYMYGRFLEEAAVITGNGVLAEIGIEVRAIGDRWQEAAGMFREAQEAPALDTSLQEISKLLLTIAGREQAVWEELETAAQG